MQVALSLIPKNVMVQGNILVHDCKKNSVVFLLVLHTSYLPLADIKHNCQCLFGKPVMDQSVVFPKVKPSSQIKAGP